jgi:hypothetical protein
VTAITEDFVWPRDDETPATACAEAIKGCIYDLPDDTLTALTDIYIAARKAEREYPSGGDRLAVRAYVAKGMTFELALRSCRDGWEGSRGRAPTALEQGREVSDR